MSTWPCPVQYYFHPKLHSYHFLLLLIYYFIARIFTFWGKSLYEAAVKDESLGLETKGTETLGLVSGSRSRTKFWNLSHLGLVLDENFWDSLIPVSSRWFGFYLVSSRSRPDLDE